MSTTELFNPSQVKLVMSEISSDFTELSSLIEETNTLITEALGSPDRAVYGDAGNKILATWDENCSTLNSFIKIYDNWSLMAVSIANEYGELDTGTAKVDGTDVEAFKTISGANKTTWLKTPEGASGYTGSTSKYRDAETNKDMEETNSLSGRRQVRDTKTNETEYYNLAGGSLGTAAAGSTSTKIGTREELEREEKVKNAQEALRPIIKTKQEEKEKRDKEREEERKRRSTFNELMQKVANTAKNCSGSGYDGYCEAWAELTWEAATGIKSESQPSAIEGWHSYGVSTSMDNIPVGAMVYGSGSTNYGSHNPYGHVGIYVGNGMVADQGGVVSIQEWLSWQKGICDGKQGWIGWGWQNNIDLTKA